MNLKNLQGRQYIEWEGGKGVVHELLGSQFHVCGALD